MKMKYLIATTLLAAVVLATGSLKADDTWSVSKSLPKEGESASDYITRRIEERQQAEEDYKQEQRLNEIEKKLEELEDK